MNQISTINLTKRAVSQKKRIERGLAEAMRKLGLKRSQVCLSFVTDEDITRLNKRYRKMNKPTDVLSFEQNATVGKMKLLGDIIISTDTSSRQAKAAGKPHFHELLLLSVHGLLHLIGYDHATKKEEIRMFGLQNELIEHILEKI